MTELSPPPLLEVRALHLAYGTHEVIRAVDFSLAKGRIGCLLGPSGCGKTTLLRAIAGFERVQAGEIRLGGQPVAARGLHRPPEQRGIGMVFQDYALFPHLTVAENIAFGLRALDGPARARRSTQMLTLVGLGGQGGKYPHELSGGQQQRVALARALAPQPLLVLLDEPFSNLDVELRERLSQEVRAILGDAGATAILVTHDQHEAFAMADEIGVIHEGRIQQWATPYVLYHEPANRFVADFIGQGVFVPGTVRDATTVEVELGCLASRVPVDCSAGCAGCARGCHVDVLLRPDDVIHDDASPLQARVVHKAFRGAEILYTLELASGTRLLSLVPSHHNHALGEPIGIRLAVDHVITFPGSGAPALTPALASAA